MKKIMFVLSVLVFSFSAHAVDNPLKAVMQRMGEQFKIVASQIKDPTQNASTLDHVKELNLATRDALDLVPTMIGTLPVEQQAAARVQFQRVILQLMLADLDLQDALMANADDNNAAVIAALRKMADIRNQGHTVFNPHTNHP